MPWPSLGRRRKTDSCSDVCVFIGLQQSPDPQPLFLLFTRLAYLSAHATFLAPPPPSDGQRITQRASSASPDCAHPGCRTAGPCRPAICSFKRRLTAVPTPASRSTPGGPRRAHRQIAAFWPWPMRTPAENRRIPRRRHEPAQPGRLRAAP